MLTLNLTKKKFWDNAAEGYVFFLKENLVNSSQLSTLDHIEQNFYPHLKSILKKHLFEGKKGQSFVLSNMQNDKLVQFIFIGLGELNDTWNVNLETLRRATATTIHLLKKLSIKTAIVALPEEKPFNVSDTFLLKQMGIAAHMASYEFLTFKNEKKKQEWSVDLSFVISANYDEASFAKSLHQANIVGSSINTARNWADLPANIMTPTTLAHEAQKIADKYHLPCTIFGREKALELGMGGFCAVDAGSDQDGKFIVLEYRAPNPKATTIALCGKGVMFDTGGINLKPSSHISGMKFDMTGAASVIALMETFAQLKPDVNVIALAPCVENMPSGKATRPDDIIVHMNGKTTEIENTDAEGRLILADTLCYAEKFYKPDIMIDIATLTGAVLYGLGHFYTGMMSKDRELVEMFSNLGKLTGDRVWELPLDDDFKEAIKSEVADIRNSGSSAYYAGTITAACFLHNFVDKVRWVHLDVAGTAHDVTGINYIGKGATGASMRLLAEFILSMNQHNA
jgi:leucyl aminopeptidase